MQAKDNICGLPPVVSNPQPLRTLAEICADILTVEQEALGMLAEIIGSSV